MLSRIRHISRTRKVRGHLTEKHYYRSCDTSSIFTCVGYYPRNVTWGYIFPSALYRPYSEPLTVLPSRLQTVTGGSIFVIPLFYDAMTTSEVIKYQIR